MEVATEVVNEEPLRGEGLACHRHADHAQERRQRVRRAVRADGARISQPALEHADLILIEPQQLRRGGNDLQVFANPNWLKARG